jgi:hypothetical protein
MSNVPDRIDATAARSWTWSSDSQRPPANFEVKQNGGYYPIIDSLHGS